jgi:hypothetical protein
MIGDYAVVGVILVAGAVLVVGIIKTFREIVKGGKR